MTFGGHLDVLRRVIFRILAVALVFTVAAFCFKDIVWKALLAPSEYNFVTYRWIESMMQWFGFKSFHFEEFHVDLIATELSSQFMTHLTSSLYIGLLLTSPYLVYELFMFILPALRENERRYSIPVVTASYLLFVVGIAICYYVIFPISFRFLGTYSVADRIHNAITLKSYMSTFTSLALAMGLVFELPIITFLLVKLKVLTSKVLTKYRKYAFVIILIVAAIITPPDVMTLLLVGLPLYLLFEVSILVAKWAE